MNEHSQKTELSKREKKLSTYRRVVAGKAKFAAAFAGDVSPDVASFMADSQVSWGVEALSGAIT